MGLRGGGTLRVGSRTIRAVVSVAVVLARDWARPWCIQSREIPISRSDGAKKKGVVRAS
jgi:hypothetical protein